MKHPTNKMIHKKTPISMISITRMKINKKMKIRKKITQTLKQQFLREDNHPKKLEELHPPKTIPLKHSNSAPNTTKRASNRKKMSNPLRLMIPMLRTMKKTTKDHPREILSAEAVSAKQTTTSK